jgi:hypothetical protein
VLHYVLRVRNTPVVAPCMQYYVLHYTKHRACIIIWLHEVLEQVLLGTGYPIAGPLKHPISEVPKVVLNPCFADRLRDPLVPETVCSSCWPLLDPLITPLITPPFWEGLLGVMPPMT